MTYIIGEIGLNHGGDIEKAKKMVRVLKLLGADCAKFQMFAQDEVKEVWDKVKDLELGIGELREVRAYCKKIGIDFLCSVFGIRSARDLHHYMPDLESVKIPSGQVLNRELVSFCEERFTNLFISTGMCNLDELLCAHLPTEAVIMHCVSAYPTPFKEHNLKAIHTLQNYFEHVGFSDHSLGYHSQAALAVACGAKVIERHFKLDDDCVDYVVSDSPLGFSEMVNQIRKVEKILGNGEKICQESEKANLHRRFNPKRV